MSPRLLILKYTAWFYFKYREWRDFHSHESHDFFFIDACTTSFKTPDGSIVTYGIIVFVKTQCLLFVIVRKVLDNHEKRNRLYCRSVHCKQTTATLLLDPEGDL